MARVIDEKVIDDLAPLKERLATIGDLHSAASVLAWDRQTYMPEGSVRGRAEHLATLARLAHEMLVSPETGRLLADAGEREPGSDDAALLRLARREHGRASKLPASLVAETSRATALAEQVWIEARRPPTGPCSRRTWREYWRSNGKRQAISTASIPTTPCWTGSTRARAPSACGPCSTS